jgi:hypothetical protein
MSKSKLCSACCARGEFDVRDKQLRDLLEISSTFSFTLSSSAIE